MPKSIHVSPYRLLALKSDDTVTDGPDCNKRDSWGTQLPQLEHGDQNCTNMIPKGPKVQLSLKIIVGCKRCE